MRFLKYSSALEYRSPFCKYASYRIERFIFTKSSFLNIIIYLVGYFSMHELNYCAIKFSDQLIFIHVSFGISILRNLFPSFRKSLNHEFMVSSYHFYKPTIRKIAGIAQIQNGPYNGRCLNFALFLFILCPIQSTFCIIFPKVHTMP